MAVGDNVLHRFSRRADGPARAGTACLLYAAVLIVCRGDSVYQDDPIAGLIWLYTAAARYSKRAEHYADKRDKQNYGGDTLYSCFFTHFLFPLYRGISKRSP